MASLALPGLSQRHLAALAVRVLVEHAIVPAAHVDGAVAVQFDAGFGEVGREVAALSVSALSKTHEVCV